jgi:type IV pilus assembly protein PilM
MATGFANKGECLGIDIGSARTKVVHLRIGASGPRAEAAFDFVTPPDCVVDAAVRDIAQLADLLRRELHSNGVSCPSAVAAVAGAQVTVRDAKVPKMPEKLLRKSVRYEAARYIATPLQESIVECEILSEAPDGLNVLLVAAPTALVESRTRVLERAGLVPLAVDVEAFGLYRAAVETSLGGCDDDQTIVLVDLGAAHTDLNIVKKGRFLLARTLPICGQSMNEALAPKAGGDLRAADQLKSQANLDLLQGEEIPDSREAEIARTIRPVLEEIGKEIRRSINYYKESAEHPDETRVDRILVGGGGAMIRGLARFFESILEIPCEIADPFTASGLAAGVASGAYDISGPEFATALGLAEKELVRVGRAMQKAA